MIQRELDDGVHLGSGMLTEGFICVRLQNEIIAISRLRYIYSQTHLAPYFIDINEYHRISFVWMLLHPDTVENGHKHVMIEVGLDLKTN